MQQEKSTESASGQALVSALMDGELQGGELRLALELLRTDVQARSQWLGYHQVGEVLRHGRHAATGPQDEAFISRLRERLAREVAAPGQARAVVGVSQDSANDSVWRWKLAAGVCSLAVVGLLAWQLAVPTAEPLASRMAGTEAAPSGSVPVAAEPGVMIRDPRLDQLIAAHQQQGGTSALQMPGGFLRNATFEGPTR
jgi:sigma-E factor negative regulatory protein RseA